MPPPPPTTDTCPQCMQFNALISYRDAHGRPTTECVCCGATESVAATTSASDSTRPALCANQPRHMPRGPSENRGEPKHSLMIMIVSDTAYHHCAGRKNSGIIRSAAGADAHGEAAQ